MVIYDRPSFVRKLSIGVPSMASTLVSLSRARNCAASGVTSMASSDRAVERNTLKPSLRARPRLRPCDGCGTQPCAHPGHRARGCPATTAAQTDGKDGQMDSSVAASQRPDR